MPLFDHHTVIILGAGASVPFGLPTGLSLMDDAVGTLRAEAEAVRVRMSEHPHPDCLHLEAPTYYAFHFDGETSGKVHPSRAISWLEKKADWLSRQTCDSIDDLIRHFTTESPALKILIVNCLFHSLFKKNLTTDMYERHAFPEMRTVKRKLLDAKKEEARRNWVHRLLNLVQDEILDDSRPWGEDRRKVKIINFNYDDILENSLDALWGASSAIQEIPKGELGDVKDWKNVFEIVHPHGLLKFPATTLEPERLPRLLSEQAKQIRIVKEFGLHVNDVEIWRKRAEEMCCAAQNIYAMGFAFARSNCSLLGLLERGKDDGNFPVHEQTIHYINFEGGYGLRSRVSKLETPEKERWTSGVANGRVAKEYRDEKGGFLHIDEALMAGFLGEMPS